MENEQMESFIQSVARFVSVARKRALSGNLLAYKSSGKLTDKNVKEWYGSTTSSNGVFSVNYAAAGFTEILHVDPQPNFNSTNANGQVFAAVNSVSLTGMSGQVVQGATGLFNSDSLQYAPNVTVMVKVTGL